MLALAASSLLASGLVTVIVNALVAKHPLGSVYDIVTGPKFTPTAKPVVAFIAAINALLLLHVPEGVGLVNVVVVLRRSVAGPTIAAGDALIVTGLVRMQPTIV